MTIPLTVLKNDKFSIFVLRELKMSSSDEVEENVLLGFLFFKSTFE